MNNRLKKAVLEVLKNNPEFREDFKNELKNASSSWFTIRTADLPKYLIQVLKTLGFRKRGVSIKLSNTYSIFSPGGDGERGIFTLVDLSSKSTSPMLKGDWGGGGLGSPKAVDTDQSQKPLKDFQVAVSGTEGGHGTWVALTMTEQTFDMIQSKGIKASKKAASKNPGPKGLRKEYYELADAIHGFYSQKEDPDIKKHLKKFESLLDDLRKYMSKYDWD